MILSLSKKSIIIFRPCSKSYICLINITFELGHYLNHSNSCKDCQLKIMLLLTPKFMYIATFQNSNGNIDSDSVNIFIQQYSLQFLIRRNQFPSRRTFLFDKYGDSTCMMNSNNQHNPSRNTSTKDFIRIISRCNIHLRPHNEFTYFAHNMFDSILTI